MNWVTLLEIASTWALIGLIWLIQLTHYPTFRYIDRHKWASFHKHHTFSISLIVMPLMLIELGVAIYLSLYTPSIIEYIKLILVGLIWLNTFLQAVPLHNKLAYAKKEKLIERLIRVNWIRTIFWSLKGIIIVYSII